MLEIFKHNLLYRLSDQIEIDLRLSIHGHLQLEDNNPFHDVPNNVLMSPLIDEPSVA